MAQGKPRYFNDDGTEFNPDLMATPDLCATCTKNDDPTEQIVCNLNRADQVGEKAFVCFGYKPNFPSIDRKAVLRKLCAQAGIECTDEDLEEVDDDEADIPF